MTMELRPGVSIDRYTLVEPLGQGGQGAVWKVVDPLKNALWALRVFDLTELPLTAAERARREAQTVTSFRHPAIFPCRALFEIPADGVLGLVFDLVSGQPLSTGMNDPRLTAAHRLAVLEQLAAALQYVHERGVIDQDIKPANVIIPDIFWSAPKAPPRAENGGLRIDGGPGGFAERTVSLIDIAWVLIAHDNVRRHGGLLNEERVNHLRYLDGTPEGSTRWIDTGWALLLVTCDEDASNR